MEWKGNVYKNYSLGSEHVKNILQESMPKCVAQFIWQVKEVYT